jgi:hypothetical protein
VETQTETPFRETLTSLINNHLRRNGEHEDMVNTFHSVLFYVEQMRKLKGAEYIEAMDTMNHLKVKLISQISGL